MNEINKTTAEQVGWRELAFAKFKLGFSDEQNMISVKKGRKALNIYYNEGTDLYDIEKVTWKDISDFNLKEDFIKTEKITSIYNDQLKEIICEFFKFEYVMHHFVGASRDSLLGAIQAGDKAKIAELEQKAKNGEPILLMG
jgi:hypothetical protein